VNLDLIFFSFEMIAIKRSMGRQHKKWDDSQRFAIAKL
jgi:hypothetical protein